MGILFPAMTLIFLFLTTSSLLFSEYRESFVRKKIVGASNVLLGPSSRMLEAIFSLPHICVVLIKNRGSFVLLTKHQKQKIVKRQHAVLVFWSEYLYIHHDSSSRSVSKAAPPAPCWKTLSWRVHGSNCDLCSIISAKTLRSSSTTRRTMYHAFGGNSPSSSYSRRCCSNWKKNRIKDT